MQRPMRRRWRQRRLRCASPPHISINSRVGFTLLNTRGLDELGELLSAQLWSRDVTWLRHHPLYPAATLSSPFEWL